jgi:retron-type reverse transcriptase
MVLELVYEEDFLPCSYGFRPGRSAHQALHELRTGFMSHGLRWVIDLDIEKYFDSISHPHLRTLLDRRVTDGVIRRMIDKWLNAGVLEDGLLRYATEGSPQGGVVTHSAAARDGLANCGRDEGMLAARVEPENGAGRLSRPA